jgi:hypothetical protein
MGFLQGALIAVVAQAAAQPLALAVGAVPGLGFLVPAVRVVVPLAGFAFAGAVGGEALGAGSLGAPAFAAGGLAAGVVLTFTSPNLSGLTGHENAAIVLAYAAGTSAVAFGLAGCVGGAILGQRIVAPATAGFALAGALGGVVSVVPFLGARFGAVAASPLLGQFVWLASSVGAVAVPMCVGGALVARALHGRDGR